MVHHSDYKQFRDLEGYFDYIKESMSNGQRSQVTALFKKLSKKQRIECLEYLLSGDGYGSPLLNAETLKHCISIIYT